MPLLLRSIVCSCFLLLLCLAIFCLFVTMWEFFITGAVRLVIVLLCTLCWSILDMCDAWCMCVCVCVCSASPKRDKKRCRSTGQKGMARPNYNEGAKFLLICFGCIHPPHNLWLLSLPHSLCFAMFSLFSMFPCALHVGSMCLFFVFLHLCSIYSTSIPSSHYLSHVLHVFYLFFSLFYLRSLLFSIYWRAVPLYILPASPLCSLCVLSSPFSLAYVISVPSVSSPLIICPVYINCFLFFVIYLSSLFYVLSP